ncbi:MAG: DUF2034 domain-containing protein [Candidatus Thioglobus sp.]|nr:DUF2034 domain-containing protein [Candidatus Thioglobus sp.]
MARKITRKDADLEVILILFALFAVSVFLNFLYNLILENPIVSTLIAISIIGLIVFFYINQKSKPKKTIAKSYVSRQQNSINKIHKLSTIQPKKLCLKLLADLEWKRFEILCSLYFTEKGYQANLTQKGADGGVDIELCKNKTLQAVVQCKHYKAKIGVKLIRELLGVMHDRDGETPKGIFITSGEFTSEAHNLANRQNIQLISGSELLARIKMLPQKSQDNILFAITKGDYKTPSCPSCDIKMISRLSKKDGKSFWGCKNFPKCKQTFKNV